MEHVVFATHMLDRYWHPSSRMRLCPDGFLYRAVLDLRPAPDNAETDDVLALLPIIELQGAAEPWRHAMSIAAVVEG